MFRRIRSALAVLIFMLGLLSLAEIANIKSEPEIAKREIVKPARLVTSDEGLKILTKPTDVVSIKAPEHVQSTPPPARVYLGHFRITYYCPCKICCGKWSGLNKTFTGTTPTEGRTVGVDPKIISLGSKLIIHNHEYIAEDTGNFHGNLIDVYCSYHARCYDMVKEYGDYADVFIVKE